MKFESFAVQYNGFSLLSRQSACYISQTKFIYLQPFKLQVPRQRCSSAYVEHVFDAVRRLAVFGWRENVGRVSAEIRIRTEKLRVWPGRVPNLLDRRRSYCFYVLYVFSIPPLLLIGVLHLIYVI